MKYDVIGERVTAPAAARGAIDPETVQAPTVSVEGPGGRNQTRDVCIDGDIRQDNASPVEFERLIVSCACFHERIRAG
jgi:hypothetical protein